MNLGILDGMMVVVWDLAARPKLIRLMDLVVCVSVAWGAFCYSAND